MVLLPIALPIRTINIKSLQLETNVANKKNKIPCKKFFIKTLEIKIFDS